jgi:hypothetical protein
VSRADVDGQACVGSSKKDEEHCKGNLTDLRRELHLSLAKGNPK